MLVTGGVSPTEIWEAFEQIAGIEVTENDVVQMCEAADEDGNNELDFSEFARMMAVSHTDVGKKQVVKVIDSLQLVFRYFWMAKVWRCELLCCEAQQ